MSVLGFQFDPLPPRRKEKSINAALMMAPFCAGYRVLKHNATVISVIISPVFGKSICPL